MVQGESNDVKNILFRLDAAITSERLALAEERRRMEENRERSLTYYQVAHDLAHLHRYALQVLLTVREGSGRIKGSEETLPCSD